MRLRAPLAALVLGAVLVSTSVTACSSSSSSSSSSTTAAATPSVSTIESYGTCDATAQSQQDETIRNLQGDCVLVEKYNNSGQGTYDSCVAVAQRYAQLARTRTVTEYGLPDPGPTCKQP